MRVCFIHCTCCALRDEHCGHARDGEIKSPAKVAGLLIAKGCLTMTYFRTGTPYYHRRAAVSRSCSGWEGVVPAGYGRQALTGIGCQLSAFSDPGV